MPCPPAGDLLEPGVKPASLVSPLAGLFFTASATWEMIGCSPRAAHVALRGEVTDAFPHFLFLILLMTTSYQQTLRGLFFQY